MAGLHGGHGRLANMLRRGEIGLADAEVVNLLARGLNSLALAAIASVAEGSSAWTMREMVGDIEETLLESDWPTAISRR